MLRKIVLSVQYIVTLHIKDRPVIISTSQASFVFSLTNSSISARSSANLVLVSLYNSPALLTDARWWMTLMLHWDNSMPPRPHEHRHDWFAFSARASASYLYWMTFSSCTQQRGVAHSTLDLRYVYHTDVKILPNLTLFRYIVVLTHGQLLNRPIY